MIDKLIAVTGTDDLIEGPLTFDSLIALLSHEDRPIRQKAVQVLGASGSQGAVEPLLFALSQELSRGASSYPVIVEVVDALAKIPDRRSLDALVKIEAQLIDRSSPECPAGLPAGVIAYIDAVDGQLHRVVPKELHFKLFSIMQLMSLQLDHMTGQVAARYEAYQQEVIRAELDRVMPGMADLLQKTDGQGTPSAVGEAGDLHGDGDGLLPDEAVEGIDYEAIRREVELEVSDYLQHNEKMWALVRDGQRIKAHIQVTRAEKAKPGAGACGAAGDNAPATDT